MIERIDIDPSQMKSRCLAYLDLLGFSALVKTSTITALTQLAQCIEQLQNASVHSPRLKYVCFSDTFLIYTDDDSIASFGRLVSATKLFLTTALQKEIPVRGAISCGELYVDPLKDLFVGTAFVEAVETEKKYDWVGIVLCQSALKSGRCCPSWLKKWRLCPKGDKTHQGSVEVIALYPEGATMNGKSIIIQHLEAMKSRATTSVISDKYENSLKFMNHFATFKTPTPPAHP